MDQRVDQQAARSQDHQRLDQQVARSQDHQRLDQQAARSQDHCRLDRQVNQLRYLLPRFLPHHRLVIQTVWKHWRHCSQRPKID